jgi:hypothetical protein
MESIGSHTVSLCYYSSIFARYWAARDEPTTSGFLRTFHRIAYNSSYATLLGPINIASPHLKRRLVNDIEQLSALFPEAFRVPRVNAKCMPDDPTLDELRATKDAAQACLDMFVLAVGNLKVRDE